MSKFIEKSEITKVTDENGTETITKKEQSTAFIRNDEPDYIKLYTKMWLEFNGVPSAYRELFLQLAMRMTYCNSQDLGSAQLVNTGKPYSESIKNALNWKEDMYKKGLRELVNARVINRVGRGVYQINPQYAGKGEWKYNTKLNRGGVEDLIAIFNFKNKTVESKIVWADDCTDNEFNEIYRSGLDANKNAETVLSQMTIRKNE